MRKIVGTSALVTAVPLTLQQLEIQVFRSDETIEKIFARDESGKTLTAKIL